MIPSPECAQSLLGRSDAVTKVKSPITRTIDMNHQHCGVPGWRAYTTMLLLFAVALVSAIGQHEFYTYLEGRQVKEVFISQTWVIRLGNALAFLFKTSLASAVTVSFSQLTWHQVRRTAATIDGLDAIFAVLQNPLKLFHQEFLLHFKILWLIALFTWILPISFILPPAALTGLLN